MDRWLVVIGVLVVIAAVVTYKRKKGKKVHGFKTWDGDGGVRVETGSYLQKLERAIEYSFSAGDGSEEITVPALGVDPVSMFAMCVSVAHTCSIEPGRIRIRRHASTPVLADWRGGVILVFAR